MSSKSTKSGRKCLQSELIVTRHRSGKSKRNLRRKQQVNSTAKSILISANPPQKSSSKAKITVEKKVVKVNTVSLLAENKNENVDEKNIEFYPQKLKRANFKKRTFLNFKRLQKVHALNKRKLNTPRKEPSYFSQTETCNQPYPSIQAEPERTLDILELVRLTEEMEPLSNEDLMEILTCPSPVWWEDPPEGGGFDEEPISRTVAFNLTRAKPLKNNKRTSQQNKCENNDKKQITDRKGKKEMCLESILDKLKQRNTKQADLSDGLIVKANECRIIDESTKKVEKSPVTEDKPGITLKPPQTNNEKALMNNTIEINEEDTEKSDNETTNQQGDSNISLRAKTVELNKLYKQLCKENATVDKNFKSDCKDKVDEKSEESKNDSEKLNNNGNIGLMELNDEAMLADFENCIIPIEGTNKRKRTNSDCMIVEEDTPTVDMTVPKVLPKLVKYSKVSKSPLSSPICNFDSDVEMSSQDVDTISDTNVKFLSDDQVSDFDAGEDKLDEVKNNSKAKNKLKHGQIKPKNCLTVYKITEDCLPGVKNGTKNSKLDLIYKQSMNKRKSEKLIRRGISKPNFAPSSEIIMEALPMLKSANGN